MSEERRYYIRVKDASEYFIRQWCNNIRECSVPMHLLKKGAIFIKCKGDGWSSSLFFDNEFSINWDKENLVYLDDLPKPLQKRLMEHFVRT